MDIGISADLMQRYQLSENPKIPISVQHYIQYYWMITIIIRTSSGTGDSYHPHVVVSYHPVIETQRYSGIKLDNLHAVYRGHEMEVMQLRISQYTGT